MRGFTLVELCFVIIISGLIFSALFSLYSQYLIQQKFTVTKNNITASNAAIAGFFGNRARLPCPADRSLASDNPNFGKEAGGGSCDPASLGLAVGACTASGGLCMVAASCAGATCGDGTGAANNPVIIGAVPTAAITAAIMTTPAGRSVSNDLAFDGWDRQLLYAVTVNLTNVATYQFDYGVINAVDENGNATAGINKNAEYVLLSHGPDGNGAWTRGGVKYSNCGAIGSTKDAENCDDTNATFVAALVNSSATGAQHYDDYVFFLRSQSSTIWSTDPGNVNNIYNLNTGNVGVGTLTPATMLDVENPAGVPTGGVLRASNNTRATKICKKDGTDCFNITAIAGSTMPTCGGGNVMNGLQTVAGVTAPVCGATTFHPIRPNAACPAGQWVNSIDSDGKVYCK